MLAVVVHENMKLGDISLNNEGLSVVKTKFLTILANSSPYFAAVKNTVSRSYLILKLLLI